MLNFTASFLSLFSFLTLVEVEASLVVLVSGFRFGGSIKIVGLYFICLLVDMPPGRLASVSL